METLKTGKMSADYISCKKDNAGGDPGNEREWQQKERMVKRTLHDIGGKIEASDSLKQRIDFQLGNRLEERLKCRHSSSGFARKGMGIKMKHMSIKKIIIGAAAACLIVGTIVVAGSGAVSITGTSSAIPDYTKFEDMGKAEAEIGYPVDAVESFGNGFRFDDIHIADEILQDESGQVLGEEKSIKIDYSKGKEEVTVFARKILPGENVEGWMNTDADKTLQAGGITVVYSCDTYKAVPVDYEVTEEDKKNMESGHFQLAYGTDQVEINKSHYVGWIKEGVIYTIHGFDLSIGADEMLGMAQEMIGSENNG